MRKLLLHCGLSLGDIIMLTAALRDLHRCHPQRFLTDVRTPFPELWEHNPFVTPLSGSDKEIHLLNCTYPLINRCNEAPYHCLHGFVEFLNEKLRLAIKPTLFHGDIHLSPQERAWYSQVHELTGRDLPFWIIAAGGKYDVTIKWWDIGRYQKVVDHFQGRIQFVQVGDWQNHHPRLNGVIDLRGRTTVRELIRLVHHSQGVLCGVTSLMHLAAAVPTRSGSGADRPCVVVAGGREPAHWEAYPNHQFIHTNGTLPCCVRGGCWKDRTVRLRDGDHRDSARHLCVDLKGRLPRCMDLISADEVICRIETYFRGGRLRYLSRSEKAGGAKGVRVSLKNPYDQQPLNLHSAGMVCDEFVATIPPYLGGHSGRGIVICAGGIRYFTCAWVCINALRRAGCSLPIELWFMGNREINEEMRSIVETLGVTCIDALALRRRFPVRRMGGWELKPYALIHSRFEEVLLLDADNVAIRNPEFLFETVQFKRTGAVFWPDYACGRNEKNTLMWKSCGVRQPAEPEFETGQILVNKSRCWRALRLSLWFNEHSDFYYQYLHGDKETFHIAFRKLNAPYSLVTHPIHPLPATMCQHDFEGARVFQHRNLDKWDFFLRNQRTPDFWDEGKCRNDIRRLQQLWDGGMKNIPANWRYKRRSRVKWCSRPSFEAIFVSAPGHRGELEHTLKRLGRTDLQDARIRVCLPTHAEAGESSSLPAKAILTSLNEFIEAGADYCLLLHDQVESNIRIRRNLKRWKPLQAGDIVIASVSNPGVQELACDLKSNARIAAPRRAARSAAYVLSRAAVRMLVRLWTRLGGCDYHEKISRLALRLKRPMLYHVPSLVQVCDPGGQSGQLLGPAVDFDATWEAG